MNTNEKKLKPNKYQLIQFITTVGTKTIIDTCSCFIASLDLGSQVLLKSIDPKDIVDKEIDYTVETNNPCRLMFIPIEAEINLDYIYCLSHIDTLYNGHVYVVDIVYKDLLPMLYDMRNELNKIVNFNSTLNLFGDQDLTNFIQDLGHTTFVRRSIDLGKIELNINKEVIPAFSCILDIAVALDYCTVLIEPSEDLHYISPLAVYNCNTGMDTFVSFYIPYLLQSTKMIKAIEDYASSTDSVDNIFIPCEEFLLHYEDWAKLVEYARIKVNLSTLNGYEEVRDLSHSTTVDWFANAVTAWANAQPNKEHYIEAINWYLHNTKVF